VPAFNQSPGHGRNERDVASALKHREQEIHAAI
jgi:hypothetical protein